MDDCDASSEKYRAFFAKLICSAAKLDDPAIEDAFGAVKREPFAGPGPWWLTFGGDAPLCASTG